MLGYMWMHPGKKLLFMGGEFGEWDEWHHEESLSWHLTEFPKHRGIQRWVEDLNRFYRGTPALYEVDFNWEGFQWVDGSDYANSVISFLRRDRQGRASILVVCNFTPVVRYGYLIGAP